MKMNKKKVMSTIGALGLTAGVLAGCGQSQEEDEYVKVVNSEGETVYISEDEYESNSSFFVLFTSWNGKNHSKLKPSSSYKGSTFKSKPTVTSGAKSGSGVGKSSSTSSGKSSGFGG